MPTKLTLTDKLIWRANYDDGTSIIERDNTSITRKFSEIQMDKLVSFDLLERPQGLEDFLAEESFVLTQNARGQKVKAIFQTFHTVAIPFFRLYISGDQKLVFARRRRQHYKGGHMALFNYNPKLGSVKNIPKCPECGGLNEVKNVKYPLERKQETIILVGWQKNVNGKNIQAITYIHGDGTIEMSGEYGSDADHQPVRLYEPEKN